MRQQIRVIGLTVAFLILIDLTVMAILTVAQAQGKAGSLVRYFEYGRSVPGKLKAWQDNPGTRGNLFDVGWPVDQIDATLLEAEAPVVRVYGMSFVANITRTAKGLREDLPLDLHTGPGAPPNFTYSVFLDDAAQRRAGDVAVLGILSSSVPAMAAMSNRTWVFEQPSPYTYPIFRPLPDGGLTRVDPIINSADEERSLAADPVRAAAWRAQLQREDVFYSPKTFGVAWLDASPFVRLVRRSLGTGHVDARKAAVIAPSGRHAFAYTTVLRRMVTEFAAQARAQDQHPVVFLIQTRDPMDVDLLEALGPTLVGQEIPYLATAEHVDPRDAAAFIPDGHYTPENDRRFAEIFLALYDMLTAE